MRPGPPGCDEIRHALGVYVLGAIDPAERTAVDRHLAVCPACRDELADLAGLPALLGRLNLAEVENLGPGGSTRTAEAAAFQPGPEVPAGWPVPDSPGGWPAGQAHAERPTPGAAGEPPAALLRSILGEAARRRARRRRAAVLAVAAAAIVLAGAGTAVRAWISGPGAAVRPPAASAAGGWQHQVTATDRHTDVTAAVRYSAKGWGTAVNASVEGVRYGTRCVLWATDSTGKRAQIASWRYATDGLWYPGSSSIPASAIKSFDITAGGHTLVTVPAS